MLNLSALSQITTAATGLSNLILVDPKVDKGILPQTAATAGTTPKKFLFTQKAEESIALTSAITDHYVEDNTALQDQIALAPEQVTLRGFVGELSDAVPDSLTGVANIAQEKLLTLSAYAPSLTITALIAYNTAFQAYQLATAAVGSATSAWNAIAGGAAKQNTQQQGFQSFYGYWQARTLFTIQTPWAIFTDMAIANLRAHQGEDTDLISDFEITFKKIRFASTKNASASALGQGRFNAQSALISDLGTSTPAVAAQSLSSAVGGLV